MFTDFTNREVLSIYGHCKGSNEAELEENIRTLALREYILT
jgi:hypothetical protein